MNETLNKNKPKQLRFTDHMKEYARKKLAIEKYSPELIFNIGKKELGDFVTQETMYKWNWHGRIIPNRIPIEKRPKIVNKRRRFGDYEADLMMGKNHKGAVVVITDRTTLHTKLSLLKAKKTILVCNKIIARLKPLKSLVKTIAFDNDQAFS